MQCRGPKYREWMGKKLSCFQHSEILPGGAQAEIRIHVPEGITLVFIGVYGRDGSLICEDIFATLHRSKHLALDWALTNARWRARAFLDQ